MKVSHAIAIPIQNCRISHNTGAARQLPSSLARLGHGKRSWFSAAFDHAVRSGRIRANPARDLNLPRIRPRDYVFLTHERQAEMRKVGGSTPPLTTSQLATAGL